MEALASLDVASWLSLVSSASGVVGTALIYFFGVPKQTDTGGRISLALEQEDEGEKARIKSYKQLGNLGLLLIGAAFLLQVFALFSTDKDTDLQSPKNAPSTS
jgi:membrane protein YqaA with SNARE-associated domain